MREWSEPGLGRTVGAVSLRAHMLGGTGGLQWHCRLACHGHPSKYLG